MRTLLQTLRQHWLRGNCSSFDKLLSRIAVVDLETASKIRQTWESLDVLAYDSSGLLVWCRILKEVSICQS